MSDHDDALRVYASIREYCETYNIPRENLLDILEDQKVLPMIRGKATEFIGAAVLRQALDPRDWDVQKLNLNPQPGKYDEDLSITYLRTGDRLKAETKNAVRGKFSLGTRKTKAPHFSVKCHKSRSNFTKVHNDRYEVGDFDVLLCNVSNAIFRGKTLDRGLPLIEDQEAIEWLKLYYGADTDNALRRSAYDDWRVCLPVTIALEDGTIPRTPRILMENDPNWFGLKQLAANLRSLITG
ncbi:MAG: hypothetical protein OXG68_18995 [Chloroflexi bacterium]|nr:hypothetical protein [Chloroflexota bacterium]